MRLKLFLIFIFAFSLSILADTGVVHINGTVSSGTRVLGKAKVSFYNSSNQSYFSTTDLAGNFSITLPKNRYRVSVSKKGFSFPQEKGFFLDYIFQKPEPHLLNMVENKSLIAGKILDENGVPVEEALIKIKNRDSYFELKSDSSGFFKFETQDSLVSIFAEKPGFYGNGTAILIDKESFINNIRIILQKKRFFISGTLSDGDDFLKNTPLEIIDADTGIIRGKAVSNGDGIFEFRDLTYIENAYIKIPLRNFSTESFSLNQNFRQMDIFTN